MSAFHLAVGLEGAGWHPAAWRVPSARPTEVLDAAYWVDLVQSAERGGIDLVTFADTFASAHPQTSAPGRLDAELVASRVAPVTDRIGLVPVVTTTHTEPFHVATRIASLDWISAGRGGWLVQTLQDATERQLFGRRDQSSISGSHLRKEAADSVEVARRLWDSWEDGAEIRDRATGRFVDRTRLHPIDFEGPFFSVRGPAITPRPPQGQPVVATTATRDDEAALDLAAEAADLVFLSLTGPVSVPDAIHAVRRAEARVGRSGPPLRVFIDLFVVLADSTEEAVTAHLHLDRLDGTTWRPGGALVATDAAGLVEILGPWAAAGLDGIRLLPARVPQDLEAIVDHVLPRLRQAGLRDDDLRPGSLRERLGLERPLNRYERPLAGAIRREGGS